MKLFIRNMKRSSESYNEWMSGAWLYSIFLTNIFYEFQVLASKESLIEPIEESESDDAILMSQVNRK